MILVYQFFSCLPTKLLRVDFSCQLNQNESMSENYTDIHDKVKESQTLLAWTAPMRPYKKKAKNTLRFFLALAFLLSVIIWFFGDRILLLPVWAIVFLFYIMTVTPPPSVENKITKFGIETAGITLRWDVLSHFYFINRWGFDVLTVVTHSPYVFYSFMVIPDKQTKKKIAELLGEHLMFDANPSITLTDRLIYILSYLIPEDEGEEKPQVKAAAA